LLAIRTRETKRSAYIFGVGSGQASTLGRKETFGVLKIAPGVFFFQRGEQFFYSSVWSTQTEYSITVR